MKTFYRRQSTAGWPSRPEHAAALAALTLAELVEDHAVSAAGCGRFSTQEEEEKQVDLQVGGKSRRGASLPARARLCLCSVES